MKALVFERKPARVRRGRHRRAGGARQGRHVGPLSLRDVDEPELPGRRWVAGATAPRRHLRLDLATIDGHSSRYFEPIVSFPFTPGHEVVGDLDDGTRVVLVPILTCVARGIDADVRVLPRPTNRTGASASRSATSNPGCRPGSASRTAADGRSRSSRTSRNSYPFPTTCPTRTR